MTQDIVRIADGQPYRRPTDSDWKRSLALVARAQAVLWHETPIAERTKILQRVEDQMRKGEQS